MHDDDIDFEEVLGSFLGEVLRLSADPECRKADTARLAIEHTINDVDDEDVQRDVVVALRRVVAGGEIPESVKRSLLEHELWLEPVDDGDD